MMTDVDQRPSHVEIDCGSGQVTMTPVTDEEWIASRAKAAAAVEAEKARVAADEALATTVATHPDPLVRELAKRLGITR